MALAHRRRARRHVDARRPRGHPRRRRRAAARPPRHAAPRRRADRRGGDRVPRRGHRRSAAVRAALGHVRAQAPLLRDADAVRGRQAATALSWSFASFATFRALTGAGIGGESSAVNSAIDELLPARIRGHADLAINGTYWLGTALGSVVTLAVVNASVIPNALAWRIALLIGAVLGAGILLFRRHLPESPRWLLLHGYVDRAEGVTRIIEKHVARCRRPGPTRCSRPRAP